MKNIKSRKNNFWKSKQTYFGKYIFNTKKCTKHKPMEKHEIKNKLV